MCEDKEFPFNGVISCCRVWRKGAQKLVLDVDRGSDTAIVNSGRPKTEPKRLPGDQEG